MRAAANLDTKTSSFGSYRTAHIMNGTLEHLCYSERWIYHLDQRELPVHGHESEVQSPRVPFPPGLPSCSERLADRARTRTQRQAVGSPSTLSMKEPRGGKQIQAASHMSCNASWPTSRTGQMILAQSMERPVTFRPSHTRWVNSRGCKI